MTHRRDGNVGFSWTRWQGRDADSSLSDVGGGEASTKAVVQERSLDHELYLLLVLLIRDHRLREEARLLQWPLFRFAGGDDDLSLEEPTIVEVDDPIE